MNLHWIDWAIIAVVLLTLIIITLYSKKYVRSVSEFLAADRLAGRYLMTVSTGFGGAISLVAAWEMTYANGLPATWWGMLATPVGLFIALTGFVVYRYRETRTLTLAQFFEMRYSRKFRFFSGTLCWLSGVLNYGIFPAVTARFIIYFFGLPENFMLWGMNISVFPVVMLVYLGVAVWIACTGGQISIMLTDFFQGMLLLLIFLAVMFFLLMEFSWLDIVDGLRHAPPNRSMIDPFDTAQAGDFNIGYFLISLVAMLYTVRAWQGNSGYNAAAKTPHEAVMAGIIAHWRLFASGLVMLLIPLIAYAVLHSNQYPELVGPVQEQLNMISDPAIRHQMIIPIFLTHVLPVGLMGLVAVAVVACAISCDDTYIHAWGTILIQDVIMPLRKRPFAPKTHMFVLRCGIAGIALFGFIFSMLFPLKDFILMYFAITGAIYMGGAGAVIIGGLYWKRGSTPAAWTAMILGTTFGLGGIIVQQCWAVYLVPFFLQWVPESEWLATNAEKFPINGQYVYGITILVSIVGYILVSLLGPRHEHNMDKLLHRGEYAIKEGEVEEKKKQKFSFSCLLGINENFSRFDCILAYCTASWSLGWWVFFLVVSALALLTTWVTLDVWIEIWWWKLVPFSIVLGTICTLWIVIGGCKDAQRLFADLREKRVDNTDNGFVEEPENAGTNDRGNFNSF